MGWTSYTAEHYKNTKAGRRIDVKAELDNELFRPIGNSKYSFTCLKSIVVGSTYYCACQSKDKYFGDTTVFAIVVKFKTDIKDSINNFYYKEMYETDNPCYYDCPKSILDLLTPTDSTYANAWREACRKRLAEKADTSSLSKLPVGAHISMNYKDNTTITLVKESGWRYGRKRDIWMIENTNKYCNSAYIQRSGYTVIS